MQHQAVGADIASDTLQWSVRGWQGRRAGRFSEERVIREEDASQRRRACFHAVFTSPRRPPAAGVMDVTEVSGAAVGLRACLLLEVSPSQQLLQSLRLVDDACWLHPGGRGGPPGQNHPAH